MLRSCQELSRLLTEERSDHILQTGHNGYYVEQRITGYRGKATRRVLLSFVYFGKTFLHAYLLLAYFWARVHGLKSGKVICVGDCETKL